MTNHSGALTLALASGMIVFTVQLGTTTELHTPIGAAQHHERTIPSADFSRDKQHSTAPLGLTPPLSSALVSLLGSSGAPMPVEPPWPTNSHVRSAESRIVTLLQEGVDRSATFRGLVATLNASDVIVQIEPSLQMRRGFNGYLLHSLRVEGEYRYLRITVNPHLHNNRLISVMAHELQHAVEVAESSGTRSDKSISALFKRLDSGTCTGSRGCTETAAAVRTERRVLAELQERRVNR